ncbi:hypothetical protein BLNAU_17697 [Blattamonas nauphoetae]|uniref:Protein kinase domain-containing protein n=1 Tax=Blattamonas nauphoetae TaxID=2049346 RepID=A0ABQ9X6N9_9EUKA|nr:hypothetical protein BLNAU_17697 [Blattamonas nauphoetae]
MIGSCVSLCTNHLYGTGIRDLNLGGSVLCSNTSFTHCTASREYHNQHFKTQTKLTAAYTLHHFSLCTFKGCTAANGIGGAIQLYIVNTDLEIKSCSFNSCSAGSGGALYCIQNNPLSSVTISSSSFVKCSSTTYIGGSVCLATMKTITISDCVFLDSRTTQSGGAVYFKDWDASLSETGLSNCLFRNCTTSDSSEAGGGALLFSSCKLIRLDSVRFRECSAATGNGHDLFFYSSPTSPVNNSTVINCDSTSTPKESRIYPTDGVEGDPLPDPTETATIMSLDIQSTSSTIAEIVVTLDKTVTGSLLVLVSNSEGTARTDTAKAPNIGRVLLFSIDSSKIGKCTVSIGEIGLLQLPLKDYKIVASSLFGSFLKHPTITSAKCDLDESQTRAILNLEGSALDGETFVLTLQNEKTIEATFSANKATIDLGVIGESSGWIENQVFEIVNGKKKDDSSIVVSISSPLSFTIPLAARLINIEVSELDAAKTEVTLSFTSRLLKANQDYEITIDPKDGSGQVVIDIATDTSGLLADQTVKLYPSNGNEEGWKNLFGFGEEYEVIGVSAKTGDVDYPILFSPILLSMPMEPVRVKKAECSTDQPTTTIVWISGSGFVKDETYTLTLSGTPSTDPASTDVHDTSISVVASSSTDAKSAALPLSSTSSSSLLFDHKYTITAITNGSEAGIIDGTPSFTTRSTPTLTSLSCKLKVGDAKTAEISIIGTHIPDGLYNLVLKNTVSTQETELPMKIVDSSGKLEIEVFSSSSLEYGGKYEVLSLWSSSVAVALPTDATKRLLEVPGAPARVRSVSSVLTDDLKTHVEVVICGENLPMGKTLSVKVKEVDPSSGSTTGSEIVLPAATIASTTTTERIMIEVYEVTNPTLKFGKTYELTSLTISGTVPFILDESVRFSVPCEPVRVISALCTRKDADRAVVSVSGSGFVLGEFYTVSVSGHPIGSPSTPSSSLHNTSFVVIADSSSKKATSSPLQLHPSEESELKFSYSYRIVGMTNGTEDEDGVIEGGQFETPSQASLTSMSCTLKVGDPKTVEVWIVVSELSDGEYRLVLKNKVSTQETELKIGVVGLCGKVEIGMFSSSSLEYGGKYEVLSLWSSSVAVALPTDETKRLLEVPGAPARVRSVSSVLTDDLKTHVEVVICGENLPMGKTLSVKVKEVDPSSGSTTGSEIVLPAATIASTTTTERIMIEVYEVTNPTLKFGKTYELTSLTISGTVPFILDDSVRFSVPCEPVRITSASCTNADTDIIVVTVEGSGFVSGEYYTLTLSGTPITDALSSSLHNTSVVVVASSSKKATSSPLQLHPSEGRQLKFSYSYTIVGISYGSVKGVVHSVGFETQDDIKRDEALITKIEAVLASSLNTSIVIEVSGTNLPFETVGSLTLNVSFSFDVLFSSSSFGRSAVIELGVIGYLDFGSEYEITSLTDSNKKPIQFTKTTIKTPLKPSQLSLCVCGKEEESGMDLSGADPTMCSVMKSAWTTATSLGILDTTMRIVDSADLSSPLIVTPRVTFSLTSFTTESATLRASPSSSQPSSVLVSVEEGGQCRLTLLTITSDLSVPTLRLVSASKGTVVIRFCSISGTRQSESNSDEDSICGWSSGLIELIESDTELNGVMMKEIEVGGIWMRGGKLNITKSDFSQNGPSIADFPSTRQNIHCEGEGTISIDKQTMDETDSMWIDADECSIDGRESLIASPLYVPTLNSTESTVETDKSGKQTVKVVGKTLMPCGLLLEVFEWDLSKNVEGKSELVDLSPSTATHWNESEIMIPFPESEVGKLNKKMELRGRLVFGNGVRTWNWMVVSGLGSGNKSLGGTESKWWIPVLICVSCALLVSLVIVVCVCLHRKRHETEKELLLNVEMSPAYVEDDEKMEEHDSITDHSNSAITSVPSVKDKQGTSFGGSRFPSSEVIPQAQSCVEVIVCNESMERSVAVETDTLFNALHNPHSTRFVEKRKVSQAIAKGLVSLVEMKVIADVLTRLSPHWVLFDKNDRVSLKTREMQSVVGESGIVEGGKKMSEEGQRWMAPEVLQEIWKQTKENVDHGAVFSLGLVLWEIETDSVPFGEVDGATAHRRLSTSEKPLMEKVSESMEAIIVPCLSLDPSQRPTLKTVLSQLDALASVPQPSHEKEGNMMSKIG